MASLICQHEWGRDFDDKQDYFTSLGLYDADNVKCYFLLDNGVVGEGEAPEVRVYRWDGTKLASKAVYQALFNTLNTFHLEESLRPPAYLVLSTLLCTGKTNSTA
ncbi:hypothetical protein HYQ45_009034 [Verticillium longisporum]|uniref:Uncharacterized protein n=1 Tax=Verticillium longisporum TaxID=100787 RepID=A0A8I2ZL54_VERLO|nr:hypothetical protein HYQ45_009034 [Verticillium longisporum]